MPYINPLDKKEHNKRYYRIKKAGGKSGVSIKHNKLLKPRKRLTEQERKEHRKISKHNYYEKHKST